MSAGPDRDPRRERAIDTVRGTRDWLPAECARLSALEALLLDRFARAGYDPVNTPVLEPTELHERKSGAGIVSRLFELAGAGSEAGQGGVCLRPELTAGIVRAYTATEPAPPCPWRVSHAGTVFRYETPRPDRPREFRQVGVERLGDGGAVADAEAVWLATWALAEAGVRDVSVRIGHVGLILEMLRGSGLPPELGSALIERLSEAAAEGEGVHALEAALEQLGGWLRTGEAAGIEVPEAVGRSGDPAIDRLFRTLVPVVTGRRSGGEIVRRLRRKWDLSHGLLGALQGVRRHVLDLAGLTGPPAEVLGRLGPEVEALAPASVRALRGLLAALDAFGVDPSCLTLDLGFSRGIGFYSQMIFEVTAEIPGGRSVELGGGGRYDGLARVLGSDRDDRGVGFDFGLERVDAVLEAQGRAAGETPRAGLLVVAAAPEHGPDAARLAAYLRRKGARTLLEMGRSPGDVLAAGGVARVVAVAGPVEGHGTLTLHDAAGGAGVPVTPADLARLAREGRAL